MDETPEIPLIGYTDRLSGRPGDTIEFKVSSTNSGPLEARLVRVISADPNPDGPGIVEEEVAAVFAGFEMPGGGAVFPTGSITFCGSLPHNDFDNNISRLLSNLLARFLASAAGPAAIGSAGAHPLPQPSPVEGEGVNARSAE